MISQVEETRLGEASSTGLLYTRMKQKTVTIKQSNRNQISVIIAK